MSDSGPAAVSLPVRRHIPTWRDPPGDVSVRRGTAGYRTRREARREAAPIDQGVLMVGSSVPKSALSSRHRTTSKSFVAFGHNGGGIDASWS